MRHLLITPLLVLAGCADEVGADPASTPLDAPPGAFSDPAGEPSESAPGGSQTPRKTAADHPDLKIEVLREGTGDTLEHGMAAKVHYTGVLLNGTQFDSSIPKGEPLEVKTDPPNVIEGWVLGIEGMKVGEKRRLRIPPQLAYGERPNGAIPANSTLVFTVELLEIVR